MRLTEDHQTILVYDAKADDYSKCFTDAEDADPAFQKFIARLPAGGRVLDFGCGPGQYAAALHKAGFSVTASDASPAMVELARRHEGIAVRQATYAELDDIGTYDGIWANFSLLHAQRADFPIHLNQIARALKPQGVFHIGMKTGYGERRDALGRFYCFYTAEELRDYLADAGLKVVDKITGKSAGLAGTVDPWITVLAVKAG